MARIIAHLSRPRSGELVVCSGRHGRYALLSVVYTGSACCVFRARDLERERIVAIKALLDEPRQGPEVALHRFENEVRVLRSLRHPNIMPALDEGELQGRPFYVMDFAERGSLGHIVRIGGPLAVQPALQYLLEVLDALAYAHEIGVVHRDVKPDNILVDDEDVARVVDFGIALVPDGRRGTYYGESLGTPSYIAPEQSADPSTVGPAADIFGVGATTFALVTGQNPLALVSGAHRTHALSAVPPQLEPIVERATRPYPAMRYPSASSMALAIADVLESLD